MKPFVAAVLLLATLSVQAAPPTTSSVERLLMLMRTDVMVDLMCAQIVEQTTNKAMDIALGGRTLAPEQRKTVEAMVSKAAVGFREEFNWKLFKPSVIDAYQETFDQKEIDGLIAFYESSTGQAFVDKQPLLMQRSNALTEERFKVLYPRLEAVMKRAFKETKQQLAPPKAAAEHDPER